ncbi:hypothetical protein MUS1_07115 [Marinomonas ushuaiensis DSM 15871]|uniref:ComEC/Rec2-related protein domain-containing protein n=2 Tax=Marinomonas TaxID=28253 RepID=X7E9Z8_9GAMM|nr:hypothetical protein MUS1_07115 [Marinomonas ushuaiensis DSM 15871]
MGAILVPRDYLWLYSTHIILVCLYLIMTKRLIALFLTLLSLILIILSELPNDPSFPLSVGQTVFFDTEEKALSIEYNEAPNFSCLQTNCQVSVVYFLPDGTRQTLNNVALSFSITPLETQAQGRVTRIVLPNKNGAWWERNLYIRRQVAQLDIHFLESDVDRLEGSVFSLRDSLIDRLDVRLDQFSNWRFSKALLLGQDDLWSERDTWIVRTLGLAHLFVVSGLHTGFMFVIGGVISRAFWQLSPGRVMLSGITRWHFDALIVIPLLFAYAYLTGWGEPVVRAAIMLSVYLCARMLALKLSPYHIITFALWLVLLIEPRSVLSPGLWLSFSMVYLLIGFSQNSTGILRLLMVQVMLSTASMVLILGWQDEISSVSILVNIILIPLAAFFWFPLGMISCVEVLLFNSTYLYSGLEFSLNYLVYAIEWVVFSLPLLVFESYSSAIPRILMLCLVCYWVYQSPLKRGWGVALVVWCVLFLSMIFNVPEAHFSITNKDNKLILIDKGRVALSNGWAGNDLNKLDFSWYLNKEKQKENGQNKYILSPNVLADFSPEVWLKHDIDWVLLGKEASTNMQTMLTALQVNWFIIAADETLTFYFQNDQILLRHSSCVYSFFLFKSDTCRRVEKLESVLNYMQN